MSEWTTVMGSIEFDIYPAEEIDLEAVFGKMLVYAPDGSRDWTNEEWVAAQNAIMPRGSEGTLKYWPHYNPKANQSPQLVVTISGSLRDFSSALKIDEWIKGVEHRLQQISPYSTVNGGIVAVYSQYSDYALHFVFGSGWWTVSL